MDKQVTNASLNLRAGIRRQIMSTEDGQNLELKRTTDDIITIKRWVKFANF